MTIQPCLSTTRIGSKPWEWIPRSFEAFLEEIGHITIHCRNIDHLPIYRGHRDSQWLLDSTFVRYVKEYVLGLSPFSRVREDYRLSRQYQRLIGSLFLYKFGIRTSPTQELRQTSRQYNLDPWFEWMKRIQQYPEEDLGPLLGSFLLNWSQRSEVALYFANEDRHPDSDGAVWIADISAMGGVVHRDLAVEEMLKQFQDALREDRPLGIPLIFYPRNQIASDRSNNQDAIYVAQMDMRCDLEDIWKRLQIEQNIEEEVLVKLVLPKRTTNDCTQWLASNNITRTFIYPDKHIDETIGAILQVGVMARQLQSCHAC